MEEALNIAVVIGLGDDGFKGRGGWFNGKWKELNQELRMKAN